MPGARGSGVADRPSPGSDSRFCLGDVFGVRFWRGAGVTEEVTGLMTLFCCLTGVAGAMLTKDRIFGVLLPGSAQMRFDLQY